MSLEECFNKYQSLKDEFWPYAKDLKKKGGRHHPLIALILSQWKNADRVALRTNDCLKIVKAENPQWLQRKVKKILEDGDYSNVSAMLGEIRAYGELICAIGNNNVKAGSSGSDFSFTVNKTIVQVEVHTPQHRTKRRKSEGKDHVIDGIIMKQTEIFPFGRPNREKDNIQGEAVSRLASIKKEETQFKKSEINILWLDLKDPGLWIFVFEKAQFASLSAFQKCITSGVFWNAFYAKKGTYIYDDLSIQGLPSKDYQLEFPGRFWNNSIIDFVIADTHCNQIVFQNPNRDIDVPNELMRIIHCLSAFNLEFSWLDWPVKGQLIKQVESELKRIKAYKMAFSIY